MAIRPRCREEKVKQLARCGACRSIHVLQKLLSVRVQAPKSSMRNKKRRFKPHSQPTSRHPVTSQSHIYPRPSTFHMHIPAVNDPPSCTHSVASAQPWPGSHDHKAYLVHLHTLLPTSLPAYYPHKSLFSSLTNDMASLTNGCSFAKFISI